MFHRAIGLSSVLLVCLVGCHHGHRHGHHHGHRHGHAGGQCIDEACTCTAPLYPGDQNCHGNCRKHNRQRPMRRMGMAFRRSSPDWMSGPHSGGCGCESCGFETYGSQPMMWEQDACGQPVCGVQQSCGCDACAFSMTDGGCSACGSPASGDFYSDPNQGSTSCGCGEQHSVNGSMGMPEGYGPYEDSAAAPMMGIQANDQGKTVPRSFPPTHPSEAPATLDSLNDNVAKPLPIPPAGEAAAPMPQDLTPVDPPMEFPRKAPGEFDPLQKEGAPAAEQVLDPVSFEVPRLPPIPERAHSSLKRGRSQQVQQITTDAEQFQR